MYMVYIVLIELGTRSPKTEVENWKIRSVFKCLCRYLYIWESPKNRGNSGRFFEKSKCLKKKKEKKRKKIYTSLPHYFLKIC